MSKALSKLTLQTVIPALRTHFVRATLTKDYSFKEEDLAHQKMHFEQPHSIDRTKPTENFVFTEGDPTKTPDQPLSTVFDSYIRDADKWLN
jgi:hypothetical protein